MTLDHSLFKLIVATGQGEVRVDSGKKKPGNRVKRSLMSLRS